MLFRSANKNGAGGLGISTLACGFESSAGGVTGTNFVLNLNIKVRSNSILDVSNSYYESWYPQSCTGSNSRCKGLTRPLLLKYSMRNLTQRGLYLWRSEGFKRCKQPGDTASSAAECCSQAWNGTACALCLASGQAATVAAACCSGDLNGAVCR